MEGWLGVSYLWLKAAHVIFVIFWISGLFLYARFHVYHHATVPGSAEDRQWIERGARTRRIILTPALIVTWILGVSLALNIGAFGEGWLHAKLFFVLVLSAFHGWLVAHGKRLAAGKRSVSDKALRIANEIPGVAVAFIVILVIVKPSF